MHARLQGLMQAGRFPKLNVFIIIIIITLIIAVLYRELALNGKKKERKTRVTQNNNEITIQLFLIIHHLTYKRSSQIEHAEDFLFLFW